MANQQGNGRNVAVPDENRPSWRPQDDYGQRNRRNMDEDERYMSRDRDDDRYRHWEDRSSRWDRDEGYRSTERYGQGQSGYGAGRYEEDRGYQSRNLGYPSHMEERARERGMDERFSQGRGGAGWSEHDRDYGGGRSGYGHGEYQPSGGYLGQGGQQMGGQGWGNEGYMGSRGPRGDYGRGEYGQRAEYDRQGYGQQGGYGNYEQPSQYGGRGAQGQGGMYGQGGYNEGMYGQGGMQHRYGSQGYQGWGMQGTQGYGSQRSQGYGSQQGERWRQSHRGKGPAGFTRSDERVRELVCEALENDHNVDATNIDVAVKNGEVVLSGTVDDRMQKRMAEDCVEQVAGVKDVQNQLRVAHERRDMGRPGSSTATGKDTESPPTTASDKRPRA